MNCILLKMKVWKKYFLIEVDFFFIFLFKCIYLCFHIWGIILRNLESVIATELNYRRFFHFKIVSKLVWSFAIGDEPKKRFYFDRSVTSPAHESQYICLDMNIQYLILNNIVFPANLPKNRILFILRVSLLNKYWWYTD